MSYLTELHCHTGEVSNCAGATAEFVVDKYVESGYDTLVITNHLSRYTFNGYRKKYRGGPSWDEKLDFYMNGFNAVCRLGKRRINVILGVELRLNTDENDYLIYGVDEVFLRSNPDILDISLKELGERVHGVGGMLFQAHPFRNDMKVVRPEYLDGIETFNGHNTQLSRNEIALSWAEMFGLQEVSGSDFHDPHHIPLGGILTDEPITDMNSLMSALKSGNYTPMNRGKDPKSLLG